MKLLHVMAGVSGALLVSLTPPPQQSTTAQTTNLCPPRTTLSCTNDAHAVACACWADADSRADLVAIASSARYCERDVTDEAQMLYVHVRNIGQTRAPRSATAVNFGPYTRKGGACGTSCYTTVIANTPALEPYQEVAVSLPIPEEARRVDALHAFRISVDYDNSVAEPVSTNEFSGTCSEQPPERLSTDD